MKFLCDVHISYKIAGHLISLGHEAVHVNSILNKWHTNDKDICSYADSNDLIVISKDVDFKSSFVINKTPKKLIKINLGNISNIALIKILSDNLESIRKLNFAKRFMVEIDQFNIYFVTED